MDNRYIAGTVAGKPAARQVYRVNTNSAAPDFTCVTCDTVNAVGRNCTYNSAGFSVAMTYWVHTCSGPDVPRTVIKETSVLSIKFSFELHKVMMRFFLYFRPTRKFF